MASEHDTESNVIGCDGNPDQLVIIGPLVRGAFQEVGGAQRQIDGLLLVDPGADIGMIAPWAVDDLGLSTLRCTRLNGAPEGAETPCSAVRVKVFKEHWNEPPHCQPVYVVGRGYKNFARSWALTDPLSGRMVPVIGLIGRDFLRYCRFTYDGIAGRYELEVGPMPETIDRMANPFHHD